MFNKTHPVLLLICLLIWNVKTSANEPVPEFWKNASVYFMLTDRFNNGDPSNDKSYNRNAEAASLRGFEGGDIRGIIEKIKSGYFTDLGVDALWMTPLVEQIHGYDTSAGLTYAYHGYWPKDWTTVDANYGSEADLKEMIATAHQHGIKILLDVILNHTGPQTKEDWAWPADWVRTQPICDWSSFAQNSRCALATSLTDIKTESEQEVSLPPQLLQKWQAEGRKEQELAELDAFFKRTGYPRAPKYYLVKWLTDWVKDYGVDGFRVDTVKHVEADIWQVLKEESELSFNSWKINNPELVMDDLPFYMVGEVFSWGVNGFANTIKDSVVYDYGDKQVNFFDYGFDALINMGFIAHAHQSAEEIFFEYSQRLNHGELKDKGILSYIASHDDEHSFDRERVLTYDTAFKLMLSPGGVQIYYGDELARPLFADPTSDTQKDTFGDAHLRTFMNWQDLEKPETRALLTHWQKLGQFRKHNNAVGSGDHKMLNDSPYIFKRTLGDEVVIAAKDLPKGAKTVSVYKSFSEGTQLYDYYSKQTVVVQNDTVSFNSEFSYALVGRTSVRQ